MASLERDRQLQQWHVSYVNPALGATAFPIPILIILNMSGLAKLGGFPLHKLMLDNGTD